MKRTLAIILAMAVVLSMAVGCGSKKTEEVASTNAPKTEETVYKIGVLQYVQHDALDASNKGFFAALDDKGVKYEANQQNAAAEMSSCQTIAQTLVNNKSDLIFAIATPAAQTVAGLTKEIPVVVTAVTDPAAADLVDSNEAPGGNITGTSDLTPVKEQIELLQKILPEAKTVGLIYCSAEANSVIQVDMAKEVCKAVGLETVDYTISNSNEVQTVVESMIGKVDVIYAPTDNMIASAMTTISMIATENNIPIICGEENMVKNGGLATYGIDYYALGYKAGLMAAKILTEGSNPADMPIGYLAAEDCELTVSDEVAKQLGIDMSGLK